MVLAKRVTNLIVAWVAAFKKVFGKSQTLYKIEEVFTNLEGEQSVVVKIIGDSRGIFNMPATKLVTKRKDLLAGFSLEDILSIVGLATSEKNPQVVEIRHTSYQYYTLLAMVFGSILVISNILSSKLIFLAGYSMTGGQIIFPLSYILGDIITEVYGYKRSRQLIWGSILCNLTRVSQFLCNLVNYSHEEENNGKETKYTRRDIRLIT